MDTIYFEILTPLGVKVRTTTTHWARIITYKHPIMRGEEPAVKAALSEPTLVRRSRKDPAVFLYYRTQGTYLTCVVVRHLQEQGFIITTYRTDAAKEGDQVWPT
jgi:hypothetical protein